MAFKPYKSAWSHSLCKINKTHHQPSHKPVKQALLLFHEDNQVGDHRCYFHFQSLLNKIVSSIFQSNWYFFQVYSDPCQILLRTSIFSSDLLPYNKNQSIRALPLWCYSLWICKMYVERKMFSRILSSNFWLLI